MLTETKLKRKTRQYIWSEKMSLYETVLIELKRKGDEKKVKWLEGLDKRISLTQKKRIQENDLEVMQELFAPKWVSWEILFDWATKGKETKNCILCNKEDHLGINFKGKFVCANCLFEIKHK